MNIQQAKQTLSLKSVFPVIFLGIVSLSLFFLLGFIKSGFFCKWTKIPFHKNTRQILCNPHIHQITVIQQQYKCLSNVKFPNDCYNKVKSVWCFFIYETNIHPWERKMMVKGYNTNVCIFYDTNDEYVSGVWAPNQ